MAGLQAQTILPPYDGIDADSSPDVIPDSKAPIVENFLTDQPGKLVMRGPIVDTWPTTLGAVAGSKVVGVWQFNDKLLVSFRSVDATRVREPWVAPYRKASSETILADVTLNTTKHIDLTSGTVTACVHDVAHAPGLRGHRLGDYVYGMAYSFKTASILTGGGYVWKSNLLRWDGTTAEPTSYGYAPFGAQCVVPHYQRLFALGGQDPTLGSGSSPLQLNTIYWTDVIGSAALADAPASWQDDVTGLTNQIVVNAEDGDFLLASATVGQSRVLFKRHSMYMLLGYSPSTWTVKKFSGEVGCLDPRSVVEYEDGCFFMSDRGFMYFDGTQLANVSQGLRSTLTEAAIAAVGDAGTDGGYVTASCLPNGYILVSIGTAPSTSSGSVRTNTFCGLYHPVRRTWTTLTTSVLTSAATAPYFVGRTLTKSYGVDDSRIVDVTAVTAPERATAATRGFDRVNSTSGAILSKYTTKLIKLGGPLQRAQLHRFIVDYNWKRNGADQSTTATGDAWKVTLADASGVALQTAHRVRSSSDGATSYTYRRRNVVDTLPETNELQVTVEATAPAVAITRAEVLMSYIEFQATRLRPTE